MSRRSWYTYNGQQSRDIQFIEGEDYILTLHHANYAGPGYLNLALVHRNAPPSWSSEKGEEHRFFVMSNFTGEQQQLDLGPVYNGSFSLEIGYTNYQGEPEVCCLRRWTFRQWLCCHQSPALHCMSHSPHWFESVQYH